MVPSKEMVARIHMILSQRELIPLEIHQFGSSLDPDSFDMLGNGRSDIDLLAVVRATEGLEWDEGLPEFHLECKRQQSQSYIYRHHPDPVSRDWDAGRNVHLLVTPGWVAERVKKTTNPWPNAANIFAKALLEGIKLFPPEK